MKFKLPARIGLCLFALLPLGLPADDSPSAPNAIETLIREAYAHSPELKAAHARWIAALEQAPQARALPDPNLSYSYFVEQMNTRQIFRIEQMFPGFGVRESRAAVAAAAAETAAIALEVTAADLRLALQEAVADWVQTARSSQLVAENLGLVEQLEEVALKRYRTGEASQADVLRLQSLADTLRVDRLRWEERKPALRARINALRGLEPDAPLPLITALPLDAASESTTEASLPVLTDNPDLRETQSAIRQAERTRELARIAARPNVMLGLEYMDNRGMATDEMMAMISVSLPIWREKYRAQRREAAANLRAAEAEHAARYNRLQADAHQAWYEKQDAARQVALFEEALLPRARQTLALLESDYRTGRTGFLDVQEAQRALLELDLALARARSDLYIRQARWERIAAPASDAVGLTKLK